MHPVLIEFGPFKIYSYGLMVALAFIVAVGLAKRAAVQANMPADKLIDFSLVAAISGILGARLLFVLQNLSFYLAHPASIIMFYQGGLSFFGGLILAIAGGIIFLKRTHLPVLKTFDIFSPYLALAQAIGRVGCLLNGCCYGRPTDSAFAVYYLQDNTWRIPTQIYSALSLILIFGVLRILQIRFKSRLVPSGQTFFFYCLFYSGFRFFMEFFRADTLPLVANLTIHQLISAVIFIASWGLLWRRRKVFLLRSSQKNKV